MQFRLVEKPMLCQFTFDQTDRKSCGINRNIKFLQKIRYTSYMVFVPMGYDKTFDLVCISFHIRKIRYYRIYSEKLGPGESQTAVNNEHIPCVFVNGHVFTDFVHTAQKRNPDMFCCPASCFSRGSFRCFFSDFAVSIHALLGIPFSRSALIRSRILF